MPAGGAPLQPPRTSTRYSSSFHRDGFAWPDNQNTRAFRLLKSDRQPCNSRTHKRSKNGYRSAVQGGPGCQKGGPATPPPPQLATYSAFFHPVPPYVFIIFNALASLVYKVSIVATNHQEKVSEFQNRCIEDLDACSKAKHDGEFWLCRCQARTTRKRSPSFTPVPRSSPRILAFSSGTGSPVATLPGLQPCI